MSALLVGAPTRDLEGIDADLDAMTARAGSLGLGRPVVLRRPTLTVLRRHLAALVNDARAGDPTLLYLTGHGGVITNHAHDFLASRPPPRRLHYFLTMPEPGAEEGSLFDVELSLWCARLAEKTANVVVIIDSCHASGLVRDGRTADTMLADFQRWRVTHQDEIDTLDVEAHPHVVRLSAAGVHGVARPDATGSALTRALLAALAEDGALSSSWLALFSRVEVLLARAGVAQTPRLSGPVRRQVFGLEEVIPPGAFMVQYDAERLILAGGKNQGVTAGDLFLVHDRDTEHLVEVEAVTATTALLHRRGRSGGPLPISPATFALPLHLRHELTSAAGLMAAGAEQRAGQPLRGKDRALIQDASGSLHKERFRAAPASLTPPRAERLQALGGMTLPALGLRASWGRVRGGSSEPLPDTGAAIDAADPLYVRVENTGDSRRFVSIFWVAESGDGALLSRSESMGVELGGKTTYLLGDRPFARSIRGIIPPRRPFQRGEFRREQLVIVTSSYRQALWSFDTGAAGEPRRNADLTGVAVLDFTVTSSEMGSSQ